MTLGDGAAPRWDLLPNQPREFFDLEEDFTQKDLKRAYNRLIRRFKPERAPDEFQRIRVAYEALDDQLRYMGTAPAFAISFEQEEAPIGSGEAAADGTAILEELGQQSPKEVFERLRSETRKSASQYYQLAVLSETLAEAEEAPHTLPSAFVGWILEGLTQHPSDAALSHLIYVYCHGGIETDEALALLTRLRKVLPDHQFAYVSERLWFTLLTDLPFATFRELFEKYVASMTEEGGTTRATLTLRLLRPALFGADRNWIDRQWSFVEEHVDLLPPWTEQDVVMCELLLDYHEKHSSFSEGPEARQRIDEALRGICHPDEPTADRAFLEWQIKAAEEGEELLDAFPLDSQDHSHAFLPLSVYGQDVLGRVGQSEMTELEIRPRSLVREYLHRVEMLTDKSAPGRLWLVAIFGMLLFVAVVLFGVTYWLGEFALHLYPSEGLRVAVLVLVGLASLVFLRRVAWQRWSAPISVYFARLCHRRIWRPELMCLIRDTHLSTATVLECMENIKNENLINKVWLVGCVSEDWGLTFFSLAQSRS